MSAQAEAEIPEAFVDLLSTGYRDYAYYGGRGGAKSHSIATALVVQAAENPLRIVCAREIQDSLASSSKQLIEDKITALGLDHLFEKLGTETRGVNGSQFLYKGVWRNPDALKSLEGADIFWGEEASRFSARSLRLIRPTLRKPGSRFIWSWNPEHSYDPIDAMFRGENGPPENSLVREVGWKDNPWFPAELMAEMERDRKNDPEMAEHVWDGAYIRAVDGAYYAQQLAAVRAEQRICTLGRDPLSRVRAFWDLGRNDATAIWIEQFVGQRVNVLDYIEGRGQGLGYYVNELRTRGWEDALQELPHDGAHQTLAATGSTEQQLRQAGFTVNVTPNQGPGAAMLRIEAARRVFPQVWFNDTPEVAAGMKALAAYHERRDEKRNVGFGPKHDWASDPADSFGLGAIVYENTVGMTKPKREAKPRRHYAGHGGWMG